MAEIKTWLNTKSDKTGDRIIPKTKTDCVYDTKGKSIDEKFPFNFGIKNGEYGYYNSDGELIPIGDSEKEAKDISFDGKSAEMASTNVQDAIEEVFQSVSSGKEKIASAITDKGVETKSDATFDEMSNNIRSISGGGGGGTLVQYIENPISFNNEYTHKKCDENVKEINFSDIIDEEYIGIDREYVNKYLKCNKLYQDPTSGRWLTIYGVFYDDEETDESKILPSPTILEDELEHPSTIIEPSPNVDNPNDWLVTKSWGGGWFGAGYWCSYKNDYIELELLKNDDGSYKRDEQGIIQTGDIIKDRIGILLIRSYAGYCPVIKIPLKDKAIRVKSITFSGVQKNDGGGIASVYYISFGGYIKGREDVNNNTWTVSPSVNPGTAYTPFSFTIKNNYGYYPEDGMNDKNIYICMYRGGQVNTFWSIISSINIAYYDEE